MKTCRHCGTDKPSSDFPAMAACRDGLSSWCKQCHRDKAKESYYHPDRVQARRDAAASRPERPKADPAKAREKRNAEGRAKRLLGRSCVVVYRNCLGCDALFVDRTRQNNQRYCQERCRSTANRQPIRKKVTAQSCGYCGGAFLGTSGRRFDTQLCAKRFHANHARHRTRAAQKAGDRISPFAVFERDRWVCGICGLYVDKQANRTDALGATIDHIIPLARGGTHTWDNVQTAHRLCNTGKGARVA